MLANVPANVRGVSSGFELKDVNRDKIGPPYQLPESFFELKEKWCEHCGRRHAAGQCQFPMVDQMLKEGIVSIHNRFGACNGFNLILSITGREDGSYTSSVSRRMGRGATKTREYTNSGYFFGPA